MPGSAPIYVRLLFVVTALPDMVLLMRGFANIMGLSGIIGNISTAVSVTLESEMCSCAAWYSLPLVFTDSEQEDEDLTKRHQAVHPVRGIRLVSPVNCCDFSFTSIQLNYNYKHECTWPEQP